jgi:hypothetical protein
MATYRFVTTFDVAASPPRAWEVLGDLATWPEWWRWLVAIELLAEGDREGIGASYRCRFRTPLGYPVSFDADVVGATPWQRIDIRARGDLAGHGRWQLHPAEGGVRLRYTWVVATTKAWMNVLAPVARPAFAWNHHVLMRDFAAGFATRLGTPRPTVATRAVAPDSPELDALTCPGPR